jgi:hypothetical protein
MRCAKSSGTADCGYFFLKKGHAYSTVYSVATTCSTREMQDVKGKSRKIDRENRE